METVHTGKRLSQLRQLMKKHQVDVYSEDESPDHESTSDPVQSYHLKTATSRNTLRLPMLEEVGNEHAIHSESRSDRRMQNTYAGLPVPRAQQ